MSGETTSKRGRPEKAPADYKGSILSVRLTAGEREEIRTAAERAGGKADSDWARAVLLRVAREG